ncbi:MAG: endonuclease/exonuclease/phosphatase family protein [Arcobacter sp.]|uniref:endonuclease/exonuclease/phosphatase family protein n=1 Tax=Arcobacter sp. TaxID=1872629 RepID=UPI003B001A84
MNIKFATFNLFQFSAPPFSWYFKKDRFTKEQWEKKLSWIKNQIKLLDADIIGFQEVFSIEELKELCKELGYEHFLSVDKPKTNAKNPTIYKTTVLALASRFPIISNKNVRYDIDSIKKHNFKEKFAFSRIPIKAIIELPNKSKIAVYVNHFKSNRLNEFEYIFNKETSLKEKLEKTKIALENDFSSVLKQRLCEASSLFMDIKESKIPTIFLCDLNDKEFSMTIDALTNKAYHEKLEEDKYILFDAYYHHEQKIYNPHPEQKSIERTPTSYYFSNGNIIDFIFISEDLKDRIVSYEVFDEHLKKNQDGSLLESDHAQVVCEVTID